MGVGCRLGWFPGMPSSDCHQLPSPSQLDQLVVQEQPVVSSLSGSQMITGNVQRNLCEIREERRRADTSEAKTKGERGKGGKVETLILSDYRHRHRRRDDSCGGGETWIKPTVDKFLARPELSKKPVDEAIESRPTHTASAPSELASCESRIGNRKSPCSQVATIGSCPVVSLRHQMTNDP